VWERAEHICRLYQLDTDTEERKPFKVIASILVNIPIVKSNSLISRFLAVLPLVDIATKVQQAIQDKELSPQHPITNSIF
jgi:hypothetical protein